MVLSGTVVSSIHTGEKRLRLVNNEIRFANAMETDHQHNLWIGTNEDSINMMYIKPQLKSIY
jgi:hypothetical protein